MEDRTRDDQDRRRDPRYAKSFGLQVTGESTDGVKAESINISTRGLYCRVARFVQPFSKLRVALDLPFLSAPAQRIECEGVVVRIEPETEVPGLRDYRLAIYFLDLDRRSAELIGDFLAESH